MSAVRATKSRPFNQYSIRHGTHPSQNFTTSHCNLLAHDSHQTAPLFTVYSLHQPTSSVCHEEQWSRPSPALPPKRTHTYTRPTAVSRQPDFSKASLIFPRHKFSPLSKSGARCFRATRGQSHFTHRQLFHHPKFRTLSTRSGPNTNARAHLVSEISAS